MRRINRIHCTLPFFVHMNEYHDKLHDLHNVKRQKRALIEWSAIAECILWHIIFNVGRILFWAHDSLFIRWFLMCRFEFGRNSNLFKLTCMCVCVCWFFCMLSHVWVCSCMNFYLCMHAKRSEMKKSAHIFQKAPSKLLSETFQIYEHAHRFSFLFILQWPNHSMRPHIYWC